MMRTKHIATLLALMFFVSAYMVAAPKPPPPPPTRTVLTLTPEQQAEQERLEKEQTEKNAEEKERIDKESDLYYIAWLFKSNNFNKDFIDEVKKNYDLSLVYDYIFKYDIDELKNKSIGHSDKIVMYRK